MADIEAWSVGVLYCPSRLPKRRRTVYMFMFVAVVRLFCLLVYTRNESVCYWDTYVQTGGTKLEYL